LAGNVHDAVPAAGELGGGLDEERRFADAGIAAEQQHRSPHEPATGDPVELDGTDRQARGVMGLAGQRLEREGAAFARRTAWNRPVRGAAFLRDGVPLAAGFALAGPAIVGRATVLADEGARVFGHRIEFPIDPYRIGENNTRT